MRLRGKGLTVVALAILSMGMSGQQVLPPYEPPDTNTILGTEKTAVALWPNEILAQYSYSKADKTITGRFSYTLPNQQAPVDVAVKTVSTSYWPTEVCGFDQDTICVAGKTSFGYTVIEEWAISKPTRRSGIGLATGTLTHTVFSPDSVHKDVVYFSNAIGKNNIDIMFRNFGKARSLFVRFDDSRDLYEVDLETGVATIVIDSSTHPELAAEFEGRWAPMEHPSHGYLYVLWSPDQSQLPFALSDADRDGDVDQGLVLDGPNWASLDLTEMALPSSLWRGALDL